ncbi:MAG: type II toxin-antitoxin system RelE/ParE family toxin [Chlamydiales bacterium]
MTKYIICETQEYKAWFKTQTLKSQRQILSRLLMVEDAGYFGHYKYLQSEQIWELKFNDGRRVYYVLASKTMILLFGGNKNGQEKDIKKAAKIFRQIG